MYVVGLIVTTINDISDTTHKSNRQHIQNVSCHNFSVTKVKIHQGCHKRLPYVRQSYKYFINTIPDFLVWSASFKFFSQLYTSVHFCTVNRWWMVYRNSLVCKMCQLLKYNVRLNIVSAACWLKACVKPWKKKKNSWGLWNSTYSVINRRSIVGSRRCLKLRRVRNHNQINKKINNDIEFLGCFLNVQTNKTLYQK